MSFSMPSPDASIDELRLWVLSEELDSLGFEPGDMADISDHPVANLVYLKRLHNGQHQYISLCSSPDQPRFLEAVFEAYLAPKVTRFKGAPNRQEREKRGITPVFATIYRTQEELLSAISITYPPTPLSPKS